MHVANSEVVKPNYQQKSNRLKGLSSEDKLDYAFLAILALLGLTLLILLQL